MTDAHKRIEPEYAPFPERELQAFADWSALTGKEADASLLRDALLSFAALRERCLLAETENAQLQAKLDALLWHPSSSSSDQT